MKNVFKYVGLQGQTRTCEQYALASACHGHNSGSCDVDKLRHVLIWLRRPKCVEHASTTYFALSGKSLPPLKSDELTRRSIIWTFDESHTTLFFKGILMQWTRQGGWGRRPWPFCAFNKVWLHGHNVGMSLIGIWGRNIWRINELASEKPQFLCPIQEVNVNETTYVYNVKIPTYEKLSICFKQKTGNYRNAYNQQGRHASSKAHTKSARSYGNDYAFQNTPKPGSTNLFLFVSGPTAETALRGLKGHKYLIWSSTSLCGNTTGLLYVELDENIFVEKQSGTIWTWDIRARRSHGLYRTLGIIVATLGTRFGLQALHCKIVLRLVLCWRCQRSTEARAPLNRNHTKKRLIKTTASAWNT